MKKSLEQQYQDFELRYHISVYKTLLKQDPEMAENYIGAFNTVPGFLKAAQKLKNEPTWKEWFYGISKDWILKHLYLI